MGLPLKLTAQTKLSLFSLSFLSNTDWLCFACSWLSGRVIKIGRAHFHYLRVRQRGTEQKEMMGSIKSFKQNAWESIKALLEATECHILVHQLWHPLHPHCRQEVFVRDDNTNAGTVLRGHTSLNCHLLHPILDYARQTKVAHLCMTGVPSPGP